MYCVRNGFSDNYVDNFGDVLKRKCKTETISSKFQMGRTKLQYIIMVYTPHFKQMILDKISKSSFMCLCYLTNLLIVVFRKVKWTFTLGWMDIGMKPRTLGTVW